LVDEETGEIATITEVETEGVAFDEGAEWTGENGPEADDEVGTFMDWGDKVAVTALLKEMAMIPGVDTGGGDKISLAAVSAFVLKAFGVAKLSDIDETRERALAHVAAFAKEGVEDIAF
jgi:hypothetical protein